MSKRSIDQMMADSISPSYDGGDDKDTAYYPHQKSEKSRKVMKKEEPMSNESSQPSPASPSLTHYTYDDEIDNNSPSLNHDGEDNMSTNNNIKEEQVVEQDNEPNTAKSSSYSSQWTDRTSSSYSESESSSSSNASTPSLPSTPTEFPTASQPSPTITPESDDRGFGAYSLPLTPILDIAEGKTAVLSSSNTIEYYTPNEYASILAKENNKKASQLTVNVPEVTLGPTFYNLKEQKRKSKGILTNDNDNNVETPQSVDLTPITSTSIECSPLSDVNNYESCLNITKLEENIERQFNVLKEMFQKLQMEVKKESKLTIQLDKNLLMKMKSKELAELKKNLSQAMSIIDAEIFNRIDDSK